MKTTTFHRTVNFRLDWDYDCNDQQWPWPMISGASTTRTTARSTNRRAHIAHTHSNEEATGGTAESQRKVGRGAKAKTTMKNAHLQKCKFANCLVDLPLLLFLLLLYREDDDGVAVGNEKVDWSAGIVSIWRITERCRQEKGSRGAGAAWDAENGARARRREKENR